MPSADNWASKQCCVGLIVSWFPVSIRARFSTNVHYGSLRLVEEQVIAQLIVSWLDM
jgi:hypothetical protein